MEATYKKFRVPPEMIKALSTPALLPWLKDALFDWAVMIATFAMAGLWNNPIGYFMAIIIIGNRQHALTLLGHDGTHFRVSKNRNLNDYLTNFLTWWPLGVTNDGYRKLHHDHHRHLGTDHDPELAHKTSRAPQWDLPVSIWKILRFCALDLVGYSLPDYKIIVTYSKPYKKSAYIGLFVWHIAANIILFSLGLWWVPVIWYFCLVTSFMMFFRIRLWLEHQGSDLAHRLHLNKIEAACFAPHLCWHHWEHHQWPSIPYFRLPELRKAVPGEKIINLRELINFYKATPRIASGTALKAAK